jgi:hypothetical protein
VLLPAAASARRAAPLALMASKSWSGHGEPAAGLVALLHASSALGAATRHPILHLRTLSPYIAGILDQAPAGGRGMVAAGRQAAPLPAVSAAALAGASSFAFMGTNAHAVLQSGPPAKAGAAAARAAPAGQLAWRRGSHWAGPVACLLAERAARAGAAGVVLQARLGAPQLAYLWEHRVNGRALFPGAGYLEMCAAAARALQGGGSGSQLLLASVSIPAPLLLPELGGQEGLPLLEVALEPAAGSARVQSLVAGGATVHLAGGFSLAQLQQAAAADAGAAAATAALLLQLGIARTPAAASAAGAAAQVAPSGGDAEQPGQGHNDGALLDVGAYDSFLQLGQVFIQGASQLAAGIYVPSGLEALQMPLRRAQGSGDGYQAFVLPRPQGAAAAGTAVSDYWLADGAGGALCAIQGMQARSIAAAGQAGGKAAAAAEQAAELLYEVAWLAAEPEAAAAATAAAGPLQLQLARGGEEDSTSAAVSVVQQLLASGSAAALAAGGAADVLQPAQAAAAAASSAAVLGMLRTAALEAPALQLSARTTSASAGLQLQAGAATLAQGAPDVFGAAGQAAVSFQPRLLLTQAAQAVRQYQLLPRPRGALDALVPVASDLLGSPVLEGQVLVAVKAVGLNFRDVLNVLGGWLLLARCLPAPSKTRPPAPAAAARFSAAPAPCLLTPARPTSPLTPTQACTPATRATPAATSPAWWQPGRRRASPSLASPPARWPATCSPAASPSRPCPTTSPSSKRRRRPPCLPPWTPRWSSWRACAPATWCCCTLLPAAWAWRRCRWRRAWAPPWWAPPAGPPSARCCARWACATWWARATAASPSSWRSWAAQTCCSTRSPRPA